MNTHLLAALLILVPAAAHAQDTYVRLTPTSRVYYTPNATQTITIAWCSFQSGGQHLLDINSRVVKINGQVVSDYDLQWDPAACGFSGNVSDEQLWSSKVDVYMTDPPRRFTVTADVWTYWSWLYSGMETYSLPEPRRGVRVVAESQFRDVFAGAQTARFSVVNGTSWTDTFNLARTCTGTAVAGCTLSPTQLVLGAGQTGTAVVSFSPTAAGQSGTIVLAATEVSGAQFGTPPDSAFTDVTVLAQPAGGVVIVGASPGVNNFYDRSLCVTVAVGADAAMECGDLRLVHGLPSV